MPTSSSVYLGKQRARDVMKRYGNGWSKIGEEFQQNALAREMVSIMLANEGASSPDVLAHLCETYRAMCAEAMEE